MEKADPIIPSSKIEFLNLRGDLTETVRITFPPGSKLNGDYVFERTPYEINKFVRKSPDSELIDLVSCHTKGLVIDKKLGIIPHYQFYSYKSIDPENKEYDVLKERLSAIGEWR